MTIVAKRFQHLSVWMGFGFLGKTFIKIRKYIIIHDESKTYNYKRLKYS